MDEFINTCVAVLNGTGRTFCHYATTMFIQVSVLVAVLFVIDLLLRHRLRATVRYWIWMLVFLKLLLPPSLSVPTGIGYWCGGHVAPPPIVSPPTTRVSEPQLGRAGAAARATVATSVSPAREVGPLARSSAAPAPLRFEPLTRQGIVFLLWGVGVLALAGWMLQRLLFVRRLITRGTPAPDDVFDVLNQCRRRMQIHWNVGLRCSPGLFSPAVCGLWRPTILVPTTLLEKLPPDQLQAVLIHELAHVKRGDLWLNCLQAVLQVVYFYHPLVWLANALTRRVREQAVDEMVLVALGAEARSYSHTLIEIAEMAFLRAGTALGLIGVAESKKALEGRIRRMVTRPIPRDVKMGARGVVAVMALGAVVLPMTAARTQTPGGKFAVGLSNGATVELVGVCHWPAQNPVCWKADGTRWESGIHPARWSSNPSADDYGFMVQVTGPEAPEMSWGSIEGAKGGNSESDVVDRQGKAVPGCRALIVSLSGGRTETTVRVAVAAGPWTTLASHNGNGLMAQSGPEEGILWSAAFQDAEGVHVMASTQWHRDRATRIVAVDKKGVVHTASGNNSVASGKVGQMTDATFAGLNRDDIQKFEFQVRPYEAVVFEGVSLVLGQKTEVRTQPGSGAATDAGADAYANYPVNRCVADFPPAEDFSTPEAAYATINRMAWDDPSIWQKVSVAALARRLAQGSNERRTRRDPAWAEVLRNAYIREVIVWNLTRAAVIAELPQGSSGQDIVDPIDVRYLQLENGRWLNTGNGRFASVEKAESQFRERFERDNTLPEAMKDPLRYADEIREAAAQLFERLRTADYADILAHYRDGVFDSQGWEKFPTRGYTVHTDYPSFVLWCCTHFKDNPIVEVRLGDIFIGDTLVADKTGWPTVPYKLTLKDGTTLAGELPFRYSNDQGQGHWQGLEGIDWHLWSRP